jgi:hypothetical protein
MSARQYPNHELGNLLQQTDTQAIQYAGECLALATVDVSIQDCDYSFNDLPAELQEPFTEIGHPTKRVSRLDMQVAYNRAEQFFTPKEVMLHLDNGLRMAFSRIHNLTESEADERSRRWGLFYPQILTATGRSLVKQEKTHPVTSGLLSEMLQEIGVFLPAAPQRADWAAIQNMFYFSDRWSATARHNTQLDLATSLYIEERSDGRGIITDETSSDATSESAEITLEEATSMPRVVELTVALDTARKDAELPTRSVKYLLRSDDDKDPRFAGVQSVPLHYEPAFLGEHDTLRIEREEKTRFIMPNPGMLRKFLTAITQARAMADPFTS